MPEDCLADLTDLLRWSRRTSLLVNCKLGTLGETLVWSVIGEVEVLNRGVDSGLVGWECSWTANGISGLTEAWLIGGGGRGGGGITGRVVGNEGKVLLGK